MKIEASSGSSLRGDTHLVRPAMLLDALQLADKEAARLRRLGLC
jgi:hypothetical protein